jgi:hypothetical protein
MNVELSTISFQRRYLKFVSVHNVDTDAPCCTAHCARNLSHTQKNNNMLFSKVCLCVNESIKSLKLFNFNF